MCCHYLGASLLNKGFHEALTLQCTKVTMSVKVLVYAIVSQPFPNNA